MGAVLRNSGKNAVFVEETLVEMAEELKIDPDYIYADFNELMNLAGENKNVQPFYFKMPQGKGSRLKRHLSGYSVRLSNRLDLS